MDATPAAPPCRSTSPAGTACRKPRGHKRVVHVDSGERQWDGGVRTVATWRDEREHLSEADLQTWARW
ncbi:hypothetical protein [Cellulosimicrobium sp. Marseille-Q4280]|uniref:hypothetical protein n=1 Tax=Cellulosimicrobium sp. Marseille-Q4280 TaxID=2937992 RepID=UPI00203BC687|nr:hypothetical protein [Cellulosimicrobium sp. Marseille-Q4280]